MRAVALAVVTVALAACGGPSQSKGTTTAASNGCGRVTTPNPERRRAPKPASTLDSSKTYDVTLTTNCGSFTFRLDVKDSPHATASFAALVRRRYFVGTTFHRIVPGFVIQGGDPTGTGTSGPGYTTVDRPPRSTKYVDGTVAMAKTQTEPPGTAGSQFFVVIGPDARTLPPDYAVIGHVTSGLGVAKRIGTFGDQTTGAPLRLVVIQKATLHVH